MWKKQLKNVMTLFRLLSLTALLIWTSNGLERPEVRISLSYPKEGENVTLSCHGNFPIINTTYQWLYNGNPIGKDGQPLVLVANRNKTGPYLCIVNSTRSSEVSINVTYPLGAPGIQIQSTTSQSISFSWNTPTYTKSYLKPLYYNIYYAEKGSSILTLKTKLQDGAHYNVTGLHPARDYQLQVAAVNLYGEGTNSTTKLKRTNDGKSSKVRNFRAIGGMSQKINVSWQPPNETNGDILYYEICSIKTLNDLKKMTQNPERKCTNVSKLTFLFKNLGKFSTYNIEVSAVNKAGPGQVSTIRNVLTSEEAPDAVHGELANRSHYSILMKWSTPPHIYGILRGYNVSYSTNDGDFHPACTYTKKLFCDIHSLKPSTRYTIEISVINGLFKTPKQYKLWTLNVSKPEKYVGTLPVPQSLDKKIGVQLVTFKGSVKFYDVIVTELGSDGQITTQQPNTYTTQDILDNKDGLYVAGRLFDPSKWNRLFVVGETLNTSDKKNVTSLPIVRDSPLKENTYYGVFVRGYADSNVYQSTSWYHAVKTNGGGTSPASLGGWTIVLIIIIIVVFIALVVALVYVYRNYVPKIPLPIGKGPSGLGMGERRPEAAAKGHTNFIGGENDPRVPIPVESFQEHVFQLNANSRLSFSQQYLMIGRDLDQSYNISRHQENNLKNRYHNVPAYDETRVHLELVDNDPHSDYINANHIDGFEIPKEYIATQGPLPETVFDFWRMIWEYDSSTIIMLTKLQEKGRVKCAQYWPESSNAIIVKDIVITLTDLLEFPDHVIRTFHVTRTAQAVEKVVRQYHFTAWPDFGVPEDPSGLLCFMKKVNTWKTSRSPAIIHCSAGVGRTGTYITIDSQIKNIRKNKEISIFSNVTDLRSQRCLMVQTEDQYIFIHHALMAFLESDETEVHAIDLHEYVNLKAQVDSKSGMSGFFEEFIRLAKADQTDKFTESVRPVNISKNRYKNICPYDTTRVCLKPYTGLEGSDYINANYIDSYMYKDNFIATQAPLESTACDFWRMVWEQGSEIVVMLVKETDPGMANIYTYFPHDKGASMKIRNFIIELGHETTYGDYIQREIKITNTEASSSKRIYHFQYTTWPEGGVPDSGLGLVELIGQVRRLNDSISNNPIVIHCSGGVGRTGVFIALSNLIERVKAENVVDVYQTVKKMRLQRTAMVQTKDQYEFCYRVVQEFLASFDLYANDNYSSKDSIDSTGFMP